MGGSHKNGFKTYRKERLVKILVLICSCKHVSLERGHRMVKLHSRTCLMCSNSNSGRCICCVFESFVCTLFKVKGAPRV